MFVKKELKVCANIYLGIHVLCMIDNKFKLTLSQGER
jgi:hypothetical protein